MSQPDLKPILNGPSKHDLMLALFEGRTGDKDQPKVYFTVEGYKEPIRVIINRINREDGSGESWGFKGYADNLSSHWLEVSGYFHSRRREGNIHIAEPDHSNVGVPIF